MPGLLLLRAEELEPSVTAGMYEEKVWATKCMMDAAAIRARMPEDISQFLSKKWKKYVLTKLQKYQIIII